MHHRKGNGESPLPRLLRFVWAGCLAGILGVFLHCAHVEAPPGGPEDKTPPVLTGVFPTPGSVNQARELEVVLQFSEWMAGDESQGQVFISPALPKKLRFHYEGTRLRITSGSRLQPNTTYILTVSPSITDLRKNKLGKDFQLVFSTGPSLDSGFIEGKIHGSGEGGRLLGLYPLGSGRDSLIHLKRVLKSRSKKPQPNDLSQPDGRNPNQSQPSSPSLSGGPKSKDTSPSSTESEVDTLPNPWVERPMYVIPADSTGAFSFRGIREGVYSVLSFADVNGNLKPEIGSEALGIGEARLKVSRKTPEISLLLAAFDTVGLQAEEVSWAGEWLYRKDGQRVANGNIVIKSQAISEMFSRLSPEHFRLVSADSLDTLSIGSLSYHPNSQVVELWPDPLPLDSVYYLYATDDTAAARAGWNRLGYVQADTVVDTLATAVLPASFASGDSGVLVDSGLVFYHSKFLTDKRVEALKDEFQVRLEGSPLPFEVSRLDHHRFRFKFTVPNYRGQTLEVARKNRKSQGQHSGNSLKSDSLPAAGDSAQAMADTSKMAEESFGTLARVQLADDKQWGKARVYPFLPQGTWHYTLNALSPKVRDRTVVSSKRPVLVDRLPPGDYQLKFFLDRNGNGYWDRGSLNPWEAQEPFLEVTDTVSIAPGAVYTYP